MELFLLSVENGEKRRLTQPPAGSDGDFFVAFSPDGSRLAFGRRHAFAGGDIYTVTVAGGEPARITFDEAAVYGLAWTPHGASLVFSSDRGGGNSAPWRGPRAGGAPLPVVAEAQHRPARLPSACG